MKYYKIHQLYIKSCRQYRYNYISI